MKYLLVVSLIFFTQCSFSQKTKNISVDNYYEHLSPKGLKGKSLTTNWLRIEEVVPILLDEMENAGFKWLYDRTVYRLENGQYFNITAYSRKSNIGFLYIQGHDMFPNKSHRDILFHKDNTHVKYVECIETFDGDADFVKIDVIPANVFILKEDCYFYQYTEEKADNAKLVTKEDAIQILRQDVRKYLSMIPKTKD